MYIPESFRIKDKRVIQEFLKQHSLGVLIISGMDGYPCVSALPFTLRENKSVLELEMHLAKANDQYAQLEEGIEKAVFIVQGPHGYISSSSYTHVNVPTYNYQLVRLSGKITMLNEIDAEKHLRELVEQFEEKRSQPLDYDNWASDMLDSYKRQIAVIRLTVEETDAAFKLSQNRNKTDFERILDDLKKGTLDQQQLAQIMEKHKPDFT